MWPLIAGVRLPPCGKDTPQTTRVGAWCHWLYWHIAEPLADTENPLGQQDEDEVESRDELPELPPFFRDLRHVEFAIATSFPKFRQTLMITHTTVSDDRSDQSKLKQRNYSSHR